MLIDYLYTFLLSTTPFLELRAGIIYGYMNHLNIYKTVLVAVLAGIFVASIVLFLLPICIEFFEKHIPIFDRIMKKIMAKTHAKHSHKMAVWGEIFLVIFVSVPLPGSGAFAGSLVAYLFDVPYRKALLLISIGIALSGIIMGILTVTVGWGINGAVEAMAQ